MVINTAMAGGHSYYENMRRVSEKHGYYRGINNVEWNMVSDYHTIWGYYQFKLVLGVAKDVEELSPRNIDFEAIGFNHAIWLTKFKHDGEDAYRLINGWIRNRAGDYWRIWCEDQVNPFDIQMSPAAVDMYRTYGIFPVET